MEKFNDMDAQPKSAAEKNLDRLTAALTWVLPSIASLLVIYLCFPFLRGAQSVAWDDLFHQSVEKVTAETIGDGRNPFGLFPAMIGLPAFRFYQCLHYIISALLQLATGISTLMAHNWLIAFFFAASPWAYRKFCIELGLSPIAAGAAGLLYVASINGTANSFEAYYELGFLTRPLAALLLPLCMAFLLKVMKSGRGIAMSAAMMALAVLAHAMFAVYSAIASLILIAAHMPQKIGIWLRLAAVGVLAGLLVSFWALPFVHYQATEKPVTDMVARPDRITWFAGLDPAEMGRFLTRGRLLDGGAMDNSSDAKLESRMNMTGTAKTRFPFITILTGIGLVFAIIGFRRPHNRALIGGFALGLLFMLGSDDLPWLYQMPMASKVQAFRVSYFIEFFAFGLAGSAVAGIGSLILRLASRGLSGIAAKSVLAVFTLISVVAFWWSVVYVVTPLLDTWDVAKFKKVANVLKRAGKPDQEQRVSVTFSAISRKFKYALEHRLETVDGYRTVCNHWTSLSTTTNLHVCNPLDVLWKAPGYSRLLGVRFSLIDQKWAESLIGKEAKWRDDFKEVGRTGGLAVIEDMRATMLREVAGPRVLVTATPGQWYWITKEWVSRWSAKIGEPNVPWLLAGSSSVLADKELVDAMDAVMYLDDGNLKEDMTALSSIAKSGKKLILSHEINGLEAKTFNRDDLNWESLLTLTDREAAGVEMRRLDDAKEPGKFSYSVNAGAPALLVLSMQHFADWKAHIDGKPAAVFAATPDLVAVLAPKGEHRIEFEYRPSSMEKSTMIVSGFAWLGILGYGIALSVFRARTGIARRKSKKGKE